VLGYGYHRCLCLLCGCLWLQCCDCGNNGTVAFPEMERYRYEPGLATGTIAAGGTIGVLIHTTRIYGRIRYPYEQSIGKLFLAGFIPGIIQALMFIIAIGIICYINPMAGHRVPGRQY